MAFGWLKKKAKSAKGAITKGVKSVQKVANVIDKGVDAVDSITDNKVFETAGNIGGMAIGVPGLGSSVRKGVNVTQDVSNKIESVYKQTKSTINSLSGVYQSLNEQAKQILAQTPLTSSDEEFQKELINLFF